MSDLVGNPEDRFSQNKAQILYLWSNFRVITANVYGVSKFSRITVNRENLIRLTGTIKTDQTAHPQAGRHLYSSRIIIQYSS